MPLRVLVATDGSEHSIKAAREVLRFLGPANLSVTVLNVISSPPIGRDAVYLEMTLEREALAAVRTISSIFQRAAVPVKVDVRQGDAAQAIVHVAEEGDFDLIAVGNRGITGVREFFLGSVSEAVVDHAHCSVLVVK